MPGERPQDYADLLRLLEVVRTTVPQEPARQAARERLLAKLTRYAEQPAAFRPEPGRRIA